MGLMARSLWSGALSFGLVSVAVRLTPATESKELRFHFLDRRDLSPIGYDKVRKDTGEHVDADDVIRGFEVEKGRFVELADEDLDRLDVELTHSIDICDFVSIDEIDPVYFRKAYYLTPQEGAEKPYRLLVKALGETGRVAIAKIVIRNKQHLACVRPTGDVLMLETMYYADEVRKPESRPEAQGAARGGGDGEDADREPRLGTGIRTAITTATAASCSSCSSRRPRAVLCPSPSRSPRREVVDLMEALRQSVAATRSKTQSKRKPARKRKAS